MKELPLELDTVEPLEKIPVPQGICTVIPGSGMILQPFSFEVAASHVKEGFLFILDSEGHQHVFPSGYNGRIVISQAAREVVN